MYPFSSQRKRGIFKPDTRAGPLQISVSNSMLTDKQMQIPQLSIYLTTSSGQLKILSNTSQLDLVSAPHHPCCISSAHFCHQIQAFKSQFTFLTIDNLFEILLFYLYNTLCPRYSLKATLEQSRNVKTSKLQALTPHQTTNSRHKRVSRRQERGNSVPHLICAFALSICSPSSFMVVTLAAAKKQL